jgi:Stage II sporulation protein E (SpoIIE).
MRLSPSSDFYSIPNKGTVLLARWPAPLAGEAASGPGKLRIGAVNVSKRGQDVCGDCWGMVQQDGHSTFMVADGLGHGYDANVASREAVRMLYLHPALSPKELIERTHQALRSTRGAAVAVARIDHAQAGLRSAVWGIFRGHLYSSAGPASTWFP